MPDYSNAKADASRARHTLVLFKAYVNTPSMHWASSTLLLYARAEYAEV